MMCCSDPHTPAADLDADPGDRGRWHYPDCDGLAVSSGITIAVSAEGWPEGWKPFPNQSFARHGRVLSDWTDDPTAIGWGIVLPNTEAGRRAAWVMEGE